MTRPVQSVLARGVAGLLLVAAGAVGLGATPAYAADSVTTYTVEGAIAADGVLDVKATLVVEGTPAQVQQRFATTLERGRDHQYRFTVSDVAATVAFLLSVPEASSSYSFSWASVSRLVTTR